MRVSFSEGTALFTYTAARSDGGQERGRPPQTLAVAKARSEDRCDASSRPAAAFPSRAWGLAAWASVRQENAWPDFTRARRALGVHGARRKYAAIGSKGGHRLKQLGATLPFRKLCRQWKDTEQS